MAIVLDGTAGISSPAINAGNIVGQVSFFGMTTAPDGFLKANGAAVSRTTFAALFAAIGTTYGAGDGSTTFALPDLRGEFPRGWDDGRGVDSGRGFGSAQTDAFQGHKHTFSSTGSGSGLSVSMAARGANPGATAFPNIRTGDSNTASSFSIHIDAPIELSSFGTPRTAAETRPRNVALLACIKF